MHKLLTPKFNTFVIVVTVPRFIDRCLETLYRYTERNTFYVYIIDQTIDGLDINLRNRYHNLMVIRTPLTETHYTGNMGHSQGTNIGIRLVDTPYVTILNDDVEFINKNWWQGVLDTFDKVEAATPDRPAVMVNPASVLLPDWSVGRKSGDDFYILPYKKDYSEEDWKFLIEKDHYVNERLTIQPGSVIDGVNLYCSVADTRRLLDVGLLEESLWPGSGNDYDWSCRAGMRGYRCVGTTLSWVFHHWSKTFHSEKEMQQLDIPELRQGDLREKWGDRLDIWGCLCSEKDCKERLRTSDNITARCPIHSDKVYNIPQITMLPL